MIETISSHHSSASNPGCSLPSIADPRLVRRLQKVRLRLCESPSGSFPKVFETKGELDGFYRFVNNRRMTWEQILETAVGETLERGSHQGEVVAIHDTTTFSFSQNREKEGLGRINEKGKGEGFFGHFCLAASSTNPGELFGVLGLTPWVRLKDVRKDKSQKQIRADGDSERLRWGEMVEKVEERIGERTSLIHVTDREGDDYDLFTRLVSNDWRFVIRLTHNRRLLGDEKKLFDSLQTAEAVCYRKVPISRRVKTKDAHSARPPRLAKLAISAKRVTIKRGWHQDKELPKNLTLNVVRVFETDPPQSQEPVEWHLITSEPIEGEQDLLRVVDLYRIRWTIEEYFKALKTGCAFEKRGLENYEALLNCLAVFAPIACKLYSLKMFGRTSPEQSATVVLTQTQIKVLQNRNARTPKKITTIGQAMLAIASLGGHLKHNGLPGWQVLGRGFEKLLILEEGYLLANQEPATPFKQSREATSAEW